MKKELRKRIRSLKASYSHEELEDMSRTCIARLVSHPLYKNAKCVLLYHSLPDEVNTHTLIAEASSKRTILLPTVIGEELELHEYNSTSNTHTGAFSIVESEGSLFTDYSKIDLAVIPGMAFDKEGNRLGRGKGYYDRLLSHLTCPVIGICFPFQLLEHIPHEAHDKAVQLVIYN